MIHVNLYGYVVTFGQISGDVGVAQSFRRHILQMNRAIDLLRLLSIDSSTRPLISTPLRSRRARDTSIITDVRVLARRFRYLCV